MNVRRLLAALAASTLLAVPASSLAKPGDNNGNHTGAANGNGNAAATPAAPPAATPPAPAATPPAPPAPPPAAAAPPNGSTANSGPGNSNQGCDGTHHSNTGNGANTSGAYDNTCDGSPSGNGNDNGAANGKPCAGCVGNADDKNPPGQAPNGSDPNKGYECDGNNGIGQTNPAHTGCKATPPPPPPPGPPPPPPPPPPPGPPPPPPGCVGVCVIDITSDCPDGQSIVAGICVSPPTTCPEGAALNASGDCVNVAGEQQPPVTGGGEVEGAPAEPKVLSAASLPFTGLSLAVLALLAIALVGSGAAMQLLGRRRGARQSSK